MCCCLSVCDFFGDVSLCLRSILIHPASRLFRVQQVQVVSKPSNCRSKLSWLSSLESSKCSRRCPLDWQWGFTKLTRQKPAQHIMAKRKTKARNLHLSPRVQVCSAKYLHLGSGKENCSTDKGEGIQAVLHCYVQHRQDHECAAACTMQWTHVARECRSTQSDSIWSDRTSFMKWSSFHPSRTLAHHASLHHASLSYPLSNDHLFTRVANMKALTLGTETGTAQFSSISFAT